MAQADQKLYKTLSFRVKDATSKKRLTSLGHGVNVVWNYCNDISRRSAERGVVWATCKQLRDLTKGAGREIGLPSQVIQEVIDEFIIKRRSAGRPRLRWRISSGARKSLGWVPFTSQDIKWIDNGTVVLRGATFRIWQHRNIEGAIRSGNFSEDSRGRWYVNLVVEVKKKVHVDCASIVGIDLGFKTAAQAAIVTDSGITRVALEQSRFYRDLEPLISEAQRRGRKRQKRSLHAKVANRRKDAIHKFSRAVVDRGGAVFIGKISSTWQIKSGRGRATLDVSWSMLRNLVKYKCDHAGVAFAEVDETFTTQTCSGCGSIGGPKGRKGLGIRQWVCGECGAVHDRDVNAAVNIARLGCETLGLMRPRSPFVNEWEASPACSQTRHCSLVDMDWCNPSNPQLPKEKEIWP